MEHLSAKKSVRPQPRHWAGRMANLRCQRLPMTPSSHAAKGAKKEEEWNTMWADYQKKFPDEAKNFKRIALDKTLPKGWKDALPVTTMETKEKATRLWSEDCINALAAIMPEFIGGSA